MFLLLTTGTNPDLVSGEIGFFGLRSTEKFLNQMDLYAKNGMPFDAVKCFKNYAFDVIGNVAFGRDFGMVENDANAEFATNMERGLQFQFIVRRHSMFRNVSLSHFSSSTYPHFFDQ